jgi:DNA repair protein SbcD/Mre11
MRFAHLADCHLGGWRHEELQSLNFQSFQKIVDICITEKVDFILISGDLFDSAYPPVEILKETFAEFRKINDVNIPVFIIAGSHDFSASGKTFLDVLEKAGFVKNVEDFEVEEDGVIKLKPTMHGDIALFGYSGKKSGMEMEDLKKIKFDSVYPFTIFLLHTTIKDVVGSIPMESLDKSVLPLADYYALGHIHQVFEKQEGNSFYSYPGPSFPNNFQELADLKTGSFNLVTIENAKTNIQNIKIPVKETVYIEIALDNGLTATEKVISELDRHNMNGKIILLKLKGVLQQGKTGDINFDEIEEFVKKKEAYSFLRNISALKTRETELELDAEGLDNMGDIEEQIKEQYTEQNPSEFNKNLSQLMNGLSLEKNEDEKSVIFETRLIDELKKILNLQGILE